MVLLYVYGFSEGGGAIAQVCAFSLAHASWYVFLIAVHVPDLLLFTWECTQGAVCRVGVGRALRCGGKVAGKLLPEPEALEAPPQTQPT